MSEYTSAAAAEAATPVVALFCAAAWLKVSVSTSVRERPGASVATSQDSVARASHQSHFPATLQRDMLKACSALAEMNKVDSCCMLGRQFCAWKPHQHADHLMHTCVHCIAV